MSRFYDSAKHGPLRGTFPIEREITDEDSRPVARYKLRTFAFADFTAKWPAMPRRQRRQLSRLARLGRKPGGITRGMG